MFMVLFRTKEMMMMMMSGDITACISQDALTNELWTIILLYNTLHSIMLCAMAILSNCHTSSVVMAK